MKTLKLLAIRHGEVLLCPVDKVPSGTLASHKSFIVGHSETGHHHVLESPTTFEITTDEVDKAMLYIRLFEPAQLVHRKTIDKHKTLTVPAGSYKVVKKTEYDPWNEVLTNVFD